MPVIRTQEEIVARIEERTADDWLEFETSTLKRHLDYTHGKKYLKGDMREEDWTKKDNPVEEMHDYMAFAWGKANDCRGLSANRSIEHCISWLWLAGEEELLKWVEDEYLNNYQHYGKDILAHICEHFGWDWKQWDDGVWVNSEEEKEAISFG